MTAGGALFLAFIAALPAAAQQVGAPVPLLPGPPPAAAAPSAPASNPSGIAAAPLAPTDASWSGLLGPDKGGFPDTMWHGTERGFVAAALPLLDPVTSPALQDLSRRLLLSNAASPSGADAAGQPSLATERVERLLALGDVAGALAIVPGLPGGGEDMDRVKIELRFAANDTDGACKGVQDGVAQYQGTWWDRALVACETLAGQRDQAALGMNLLSAEKGPPDPGFDALVAAAGGSVRRIDKIIDPSPMRLALLAAAKAPLPAETLANAGPAALLVYATSAKVPLERRLAAAERAAALGAIAPDALLALYRAVPASDADRAAATAAERPPDDKSRAILYQVALSGAPQATRTSAMAILVADAKKRGLFPLAARLLAPAVTELDPTGTSPEFAADAARILLVSGDAGKAQPWIDAAGAKPLALLSRLGTPSDNAAPLLHDAVAALAARNAASAPAQADLLVALVAAFDEPVDGLDWSPLLAPPHAAAMPDAALWLDQQQASAGNRLGETVLSSILLLSADGQLSLEPVLLQRTVEGLRKVGLDADARAIAIEAAVDAGI